MRRNLRTTTSYPACLETFNLLPVSDVTYDLSLLEQSREKWDRSPAVRAFYGDVFAVMMAHARSGETLDLGSGIGVIKDFFPDVVTSDIEKTPFVDLAVSCYDIEDAGKTWGNLLAFDVLHHLTKPLDFFQSAANALRPGGRLILTEPAATPGGRLFYKLCHHEPMEPAVLQPPFKFEADTPDGEFANMGMGVALFVQHFNVLKPLLQGMGLSVCEIMFRDVWAYPLTGGFSKPQLLPTAVIRWLLKCERALPKFLLHLCALRMIIVLEKQ